MMRSFLILAVILSTALSADEKKKRYVFVNGGNTPTSNHEYHEKDILAFHSALFGTKDYVVLNAGGKGTLVNQAYGTMARDDQGRLKFAPSQITFDTLPATKSNLIAQFDKIKSDGITEATLIFGDHGGRAGVTLWNGDKVSARELRALDARLPESTVVRTLHLHCFSGASLVNPDRKVPATLAEWDTFRAANYRANRCGLALSNHDELGVYFSSEKLEDHPFTKILKKEPPPSLLDFRQMLIDSKHEPFPVRTSDYLVDDAMKFMCKTGRVPSWDRHASGDEPAEKRELSLEDECKELTEDKVFAEANKKFQDVLHLWSNAVDIKWSLALKFLTKKYPTEAAGYDEAKAMVEKLQAEHVVKTKDKELSTEEQLAYEKKLTETRTQAMNEFGYWITATSRRENFPDEFQEFLKTDEAKAYMKSDELRKKLPYFFKFWDAPENKDKEFLTATSDAKSTSDAIQLARKKVAVDSQDKRRKFVKARLAKAPELEATKELLEKIEKCEAAPL